jgi:hypothetical protein
MAQNLRIEDSVDKCLNLVRRNIRLCSQIKGADGLIGAIKPFYDSCSAKNAELAKAVEEAEDNYDLSVFQDGELDLALRNLGGRCKEQDRSKPGSVVFASMFPDGVDAVTKMNREDEPDEADKIARRIELLGTEHPLLGNAAIIREEAQKSRDACNKYNESCKKIAILKTELDVLKMAMITKYAENILDATKLFGKDYAGRYFPKIRISNPAKIDAEKINTKEEQKEMAPAAV